MVRHLLSCHTLMCWGWGNVQTTFLRLTIAVAIRVAKAMITHIVVNL